MMSAHAGSTRRSVASPSGGYGRPRTGLAAAAAQSLCRLGRGGDASAQRCACTFREPVTTSRTGRDTPAPARLSVWPSLLRHKARWVGSGRDRIRMRAVRSAPTARVAVPLPVSAQPRGRCGQLILDACAAASPVVVVSTTTPGLWWPVPVTVGPLVLADQPSRRGPPNAGHHLPTGLARCSSVDINPNITNGHATAVQIGAP